MTIRKRTWISHIVLFLVPIMTVIVLLATLGGSLFLYIRNGNHWHAANYSQFQYAAGLSRYVTQTSLSLGASAENSTVFFAVLDPVYNHVRIIKNGILVYDYGNRSLVGQFPDEITNYAEKSPLAYAKGGLYFHSTPFSIQNDDYMLYIISTQAANSSNASLVSAITNMLIVMALLLVLATFLTSQFITKFMLDRILSPLNELHRGATSIQQGNLNIHLRHDRDDEYGPIFEHFNTMAEALSNSLKEREYQEQRRKELIAGISHDIRSPLTSIKAYVEGLLDGIASTPTAQEKYLKIIQRKVNDVDNMLNQLFLFSRLDANEETLILNTLDISSFTNEFIGDNVVAYRSRGLEITSTLPNMPLLISGDAAILTRLYRNIFDNSAKYKIEEHASCHLDVSSTDTDVILTFTDNGPGVGEEDLERIFEPFYRTDSARTNPQDSSGLGLSITAKAIRSMRGTISAHNVQPHGLSIVISLPRKDMKKHG